MIGQVMTRWIAVLIVVVAFGGCAKQHKQRIALLEQTNRNLAESINAMRNQLDATDRNRNDIDGQLLAAHDQIDELQRRLAELPPPQEAAPGWTAVPGGAMIAIQSSVLFAPGKATLRPESRRTLDAIVSTLQGEYGDQDVLVFGHTDDRPIKKSGWADNWELSTQRALAVVRYLKDRGVVPSRLAACGGGEFHPLAPNTSESKRAQNRRVEIFAVHPELRLGRS
ncbi:MAG: OmpA family protein [Planctomycetes bacterium]|nr:OmpA family protein [Planctomycetota bacterium]